MELPDATTTVAPDHPRLDEVPKTTALGLLALVHRVFEGRLELPDRAGSTMPAPFLRAWTELLAATCHRRGARASAGVPGHLVSDEPTITENACGAVCTHLMTAPAPALML